MTLLHDKSKFQVREQENCARLSKCSAFTAPAVTWKLLRYLPGRHGAQYILGGLIQGRVVQSSIRCPCGLMGFMPRSNGTHKPGSCILTENPQNGHAGGRPRFLFDPPLRSGLKKPQHGGEMEVSGLTCLYPPICRSKGGRRLQATLFLHQAPSRLSSWACGGRPVRTKALTGSHRVAVSVVLDRCSKCETSNSSWTETICHYSAPWSELATDNIILTVPSDYVRSLENPAELLSLWDKMMKAVAELSGVHFPLARPERIVADVQISGGWMHSGYPIMCHVQSAKSLVDAKSILSKGLWGPIHELGHNQQRSEWQIMPHTFEAMCNMWTVYVHEKVLNISRNKAHPNLQDEERSARTIRYLENGSRLENWHEATCLETYLQLQEGFGWEPFKQLFSAYHNISKVKKENKYKMNLWADMFSKAVGKNLVSFFKLWGWPIDNEVSNNLSSLPDWEKDPMKKYVMKLATIRN
ncbi:TRPM8 channel-associated factor homolog [Lissotriton helveticus]